MQAARAAQQARLDEAAAARGDSAPRPAAAASLPPTPSVPAVPKAAEDAAPRKVKDEKKGGLSMAERLAKIEKGKGPSGNNPLMPQSSASSAGSGFTSKKRGG